MTGFSYYNKLIIPKILLSKYIYLKKQDLPQITKFQIAALTHKEQVSTSIYLLFLLFLRKPSFFRKPWRRNAGYKLHEIFITTHTKKSYFFFEIFAHFLFPYQIENSKIMVKKPDILPIMHFKLKQFKIPSNINQIFYYYIPHINTVDLRCIFEYKTFSTIEILFLLQLNLFPIQLNSNKEL